MGKWNCLKMFCCFVLFCFVLFCFVFGANLICVVRKSAVQFTDQPQQLDPLTNTSQIYQQPPSLTTEFFVYSFQTSHVLHVSSMGLASTHTSVSVNITANQPMFEEEARSSTRIFLLCFSLWSPNKWKDSSV